MTALVVRKLGRTVNRKRLLRVSARITEVVDGDTIKVRAFHARRSRYTVRLIGIDTPETKRPGTPVECGGPDATASMFRLSFTAPEDADGDDLVDTKGGTRPAREAGHRPDAGHV